MKKVLNILVAALIALGAAIPVIQVAEAEEEEGPPIYLTISQCIGTNSCPELGESYENTVEWSFNDTVPNNDMDPILGLAISCTGEDCPESVTVYWEATGSFIWSKSAGYPYDGAAFTVEFQAAQWKFPCGAGYEGTCDFHASGSYELELGHGGYYLKYWIGCNNEYCTQGVTTTVKVSVEPLDTCEDYEDQEEVASGTLDPTDEDGDYVELVNGIEYRVTVSGGPWNDGANNRYDAAVKEGEEDWQSVSALLMDEEQVNCETIDPEDNSVSYVFTAEDVDWRIRVNDLAGAFADNTGSLDYSISRVIDAGALDNCEDSFLVVGDPIYSGTIQATDSAGELAFTKDLNGRPTIGDYIAITFTGTWQNNGTGEELQDVAMQIGSGAWVSLDTTDGLLCSTVTGEVEPVSTYYMQVTSSLPHYFRVDDQIGGWSLNTGSLDFTISMVIYAPPVNGCGMDFVVGDYLGKVSAIANSSSGIDYEFPFDNITMNGTAGGPLIFAVEVSGSFLDAGIDSVAADIKHQDMNPDWEDMATYSDALCIETVDAVGHLRIYLGVYPDDPYFKFRVQDAVSYSDNTGMLDFMIYQAESLNVDDPPLGDPCGDNYSKGTLITTLTIDSTKSWYALTDYLQEGQYYAIETTDGPWYDDGVPSNFVGMTALADGYGLLSAYTITELSEFALCAQDSEDIYMTAFIYAQPDYQYLLRVYDELLDLGDNTGSIKVRIYNATDEADMWETCADAYSISQMTTDPAKTIVPANQESGTKIEYILPGGFYAIEITGDYAWSDPDVEASYLAEICDPGLAGCIESSWIPLSDADDEGIAVCVVTVDTTKPTYRIYVDVAGPLRLRVADDDGTFEENSGKLTYILYAQSNPNGLPDPGLDPGVDPWEASCYSRCMAPDGLWIMVGIIPLPNVGGWIAYGTCAIVSYFTWCPQHTEALKGAGTSILDTVEPMATMNDLIDFVKAAKGQFDSIEPYISVKSVFSNNGEVGGAPLSFGDINGNLPDAPDIIALSPLDLLTGEELDMNGNPWFGGAVDLKITNVSDPERAAAIAACTEGGMKLSLGDGTAAAVCQFQYLIKNSKFFIALITVMDIVLIGFIVFRYLPWNVKRFLNLIMNKDNRSAIGTILDSF